MKNVKSKCLKTTQHVADKILLLRRAKRFSQDKFAEFVGLDTRTITRAENGHKKMSRKSHFSSSLIFLFFQTSEG